MFQLTFPTMMILQTPLIHHWDSTFLTDRNINNKTFVRNNATKPFIIVLLLLAYLTYACGLCVFHRQEAGESINLPVEQAL